MEHTNNSIISELQPALGTYFDDYAVRRPEWIIDQTGRLRRKISPVLGDLMAYLVEAFLGDRKLTMAMVAEEHYGLSPEQQKPELTRDPVTGRMRDNRPSIHRVHLSYLRTTLEHYYEEAGRDDLIHIAIPRRSCTPEFRLRFLPLEEAGRRKLQRSGEFRSQRTPRGLREAIRPLNEILETNPDHPVIHGRLAEIRTLRAVHGIAPPRAELELGLRHSERALTIAKDLWEAHASQGFIHAYLNWDWDKADQAFARAVAMAQRHVKLLPGYAAYRMARGGYDELIADLEQSASDLCDVSAMHRQTLGVAHLFSGNWDEAERHLRCSTPHYMAHLHLAILNEARGDYAAALNEIRFAVAQQDCESLVGGFHVLMLCRAGERAEALEQMARLRQTPDYVSRFQLAVAHLGLDEHDKALDFLEAAAEEREYEVLLLSRWPIFREVQQHPRYSLLLEKIGLGAYESSFGHRAQQSGPRGAHVA